MNENLQFLQALKDVSDEDFNEDMNSISLTGEHEFSDKFNRKMKKLIARQKKQYFRFVSTAGRRAACIILVYNKNLFESQRCNNRKWNGRRLSDFY